MTEKSCINCGNYIRSIDTGICADAHTHASWCRVAGYLNWQPREEVEGFIMASGESTTPPDQTVKEDAGKPELSLVLGHFPKAIEGAAQVRQFSRNSKNRPDDSWKAVESSRWLESALRHIVAMAAGETIDPESGLPHVDHLLCGALVMSELEKNKNL